LPRFILQSWGISFAGSVALGGMLLALTGQASTRSEIKLDEPSIWFGFLVFAPVVETLLMLGVLWLIRGAGFWWKVGLSAVLWGAIHVLVAGPAAFATAVAFAGFTYALLVLPKTIGARAAMWVTILIHLLHNLTALLLFAAVS
jgi:membrane protease YdiL (CAAX protease family)